MSKTQWLIALVVAVPMYFGLDAAVDWSVETVKTELLRAPDPAPK